MYQVYFPIKRLAQTKRMSERELARTAKVSRTIINKIKNGRENLSLSSLSEAAEFFQKDIKVLTTSEDILPEFSVAATAYKVERDGFDSWKIHFMDYVDYFRKTLDPVLCILGPHSQFDFRLTALLASIVSLLCEECGMPAPPWAKKRYFLDRPWFVSGVEALKPAALLESPPAFRNNNIFVLENFCARV